MITILTLNFKFHNKVLYFYHFTILLVLLKLVNFNLILECFLDEPHFTRDPKVSLLQYLT